jgi:hypothetical protein
MTATVDRTPRALLIVAWLVVGLPAAWGVGQTFLKSLDLFRAPAATSAATAPMR